MNRPTFDDGSGFGARSVKWFVAGAPGVGILLLLAAQAAIDTTGGLGQLMLCAVIPGIWSLITWGNGFAILSMGRQEIRPPHPKGYEVRFTLNDPPDAHYSYYGETFADYGGLDPDPRYYEEVGNGG